MNSRNPYHIEGEEPKLLQSVVLFMDILGYKDMIRQSTSPGTQQELLIRLHRVLTEERSMLEDKQLPSYSLSLADREFYALKAFTDNIIMGWPVRHPWDAEVELMEARSKIAYFQFRLALQGFFVRGAIAVGEAYIDEVVVFGRALLDAYDGESKLARVPRIVLTGSAVDAVKQYLPNYDSGLGAQQVRDILCDSDDQWFVNYLDQILIAEDECGPFFEDLLRHKVVVEEKLKNFKRDPLVWAKYAWVAAYHNYFCEQRPDCFEEKHKVDIELFRGYPSRIVEEKDCC